MQLPQWFNERQCVSFKGEERASSDMLLLTVSVAIPAATVSQRFINHHVTADLQPFQRRMSLLMVEIRLRLLRCETSADPGVTSTLLW
jgi:hypothetical protein